MFPYSHEKRQGLSSQLATYIPTFYGSGLADHHLITFDHIGSLFLLFRIIFLSL